MFSFENVIAFKYLGVKFSNGHRSLFQDYNKCVVEKAEMYSRTIMSQQIRLSIFSTYCSYNIAIFHGNCDHTILLYFMVNVTIRYYYILW